MKILKTPWKDDLLNFVADSKKSVKITSPFIKENVCRDLVSVKSKNAKLELLTSFKLTNIYSGSLDLSALEVVLANNGSVKNFSKLHSKIYLFDDVRAVITSGNLTNGGLLKNFEYGIFVDDFQIVSQIREDFQTIWTGENTGTVRQTDIDSVRKILSEIPKIETVKLPAFTIDKDSPEEQLTALMIAKSAIDKTLSGWKLEVFRMLNQLSEQEFALDDVYKFEKYFRRKYPTNKNIKDKIRQQLQYLRDLGLLEFLGAGNYRKLWKWKIRL